MGWVEAKTRFLNQVESLKPKEWRLHHIYIQQSTNVKFWCPHMFWFFFTMSCLGFFFNKFASCNDPLLSFTVLIEKVTGARHKPQTPSSAHHLPTQSVTSQADTLDCHLSSGTGTPSCHTSAFTACALEQLSSCSQQRKPPPYKPYYGDNWATIGQKLVKAQRGIHP